MAFYLVGELRAAHMADLCSQLVRAPPDSRVSGSYALIMVALPEIFQ